MKKWGLIILMALWIFACQASIRQVNNMEEIFDHFKDADSKTLAIFDVDMVLVQPSDPAFQMANMKRFGSICKRIMREIPADKHAIFLSLITLDSDPMLIDSHTPRFLEQLIQKRIPTMAMTANLTGKLREIQHLEKWRIESLRKLGIDFSKAAPYQMPLIFDHLPPYRGNYSAYLEGILFVNGTQISKGEAFIAFVEKANVFPHKVIFIDDRQDNLESLEIAIQKLHLPIEYVGLHFLGAQNYPSKIISEDEFESRWQKLAFELQGLN